MSRNAWISVEVLAVALAACEAPPPAPSVTLRIAVFQSMDFLPY